MKLNPTSLRALTFAAATVIGSTLSAHPQNPDSSSLPFGETLEATAVTVTILARDDSGDVVVDLRPEEILLSESGVSRAVVSVTPWTPRRGGVRPSDATAPTSAGDAELPGTAETTSIRTDGRPSQPGSGAETGQVVIYIDGVLSSRQGVVNALTDLAARSEDLVGLGRVEVVVADPTPRVQLTSNDTQAVRTTLERLAQDPPGVEAHVRLRREYLRSVEQEGLDDLLGVMPGGGGGGEAPQPQNPGGSGTPGGGGNLQPESPRNTSRVANPAVRGRRQRMIALSAAREETALLERQREILANWISSNDRGAPGALFLVSDGYDSDPRDFYLATYHESSLTAELSADLRPLDSGARVDELAALIGGAGWTIYPVAMGSLHSVQTTDASQSGRARSRSFSRNKGPDSNLTSFTLRHPLEPLRQMAALTGGEVTTSSANLNRELDAVGSRLLITYQVDRAPDGKIRPIEVSTTRAGVTLSAPRVAAGASPDAIAARRVRRALAGAEDSGDLAVDLTLALDPATGNEQSGSLDVAVQLNGFASSVSTLLTHPRFRVTLGILLPDDRVFVSHQFPNPPDLSQVAVWQYTIPLRVPSGTVRFAVVVDELSTGLWGVAASTSAP